MSKYSIQIDGTDNGFARATKATVVAEADRLRKSGERGAIDVVTSAGTTVYALKAVKSRVITFHTKAFTKTVELPEALQALVPAGYVAAYERPRNGAVVLRRETDEAEDEARYAVLNVTTGALEAFVPTTRAAGQVMKGIRKPANA